MYPLYILLFINVFLYSWINLYHGMVSFSKNEYLYNANHYIPDPRINGGDFSLINALGQYDGQWYLKIADQGYPDHPKAFLNEPVKEMDGLTYNFFPLYPISIASVNFFIKNVELSAFITSNLLLLGSVYSIYFVVSQWYSKKVAYKTILLLLLFPFSILLRGYYAESIRLFLFIWFCYGLSKRNYLIGALSVGLLSVSSGISLLLLLFYFGVLWFDRKKLTLHKTALYFVIACVPFILWILFCFLHTGDGLIFILTRYAWIRPPLFPLLYNIFLVFEFPFLPVRGFYGSQLDVYCIIVTLCVAFLSKRILPKVVWLATIVLAFSPLLFQSSVSFARFITVLFPFFVYLAVVLKKKYYILLVCVFTVGLLISSLYFVNWYWIE
jgi:hypothetical protein